MKRFLTFLTFALAVAFVLPMAACGHKCVPPFPEDGRLSSMTEEQCREFIKEYGVIIPEYFEGLEDFSIKDVIKNVEEYPGCYMAISWDVSHYFWKDTSEAVWRYYNSMGYYWQPTAD